MMAMDSVTRCKPVIGLAGGIGSGKSTVAEQLSVLGCCVIDADADARAQLADDQVVATLVDWWGRRVLDGSGAVDRSQVASIVFADVHERERLEGLIHPRVAALLDRKTAGAMADDRISAVVWDVPLLFETGLSSDCDAVIYVDAPLPLRCARVALHRGWDALELSRRENNQMPLDKKRKMSHYVIENISDTAFCHQQVRRVFFQITGQ